MISEIPLSRSFTVYLFITSLLILTFCSSCSPKSNFMDDFTDLSPVRPKIIRFSIDIYEEGELCASFYRPHSIYVSKNMELILHIPDTITYFSVGAAPTAMSTAIPFYEITDTLVQHEFTINPKALFCEKAQIKEDYAIDPVYITISFRSDESTLMRLNIYKKNFTCD